MSIDVFATIDHNALHEKSARYIKRALKMKKENDIDGYILFASLSLELLAKASLSKVNKLLIVDHRSHDSLRVALEIKSKIDRNGKEVDIRVEDVRTIGAAEAYKKVALILPTFNKDNENACQNMARIRNAELHSGASTSNSLENYWEGSYFYACSVILNSYGYDLDQWNGEAEGEYISSIVDATINRLEEAKERAVNSVNKAREEIQNINSTELENRIKKSKNFKLHEKYLKSWPLECPICHNSAHAAGKETFDSVMDFMIALEQGSLTNNLKKEFFPSKFHCAVCKLRLDNEEEIDATKLFETHIM